MKSNAIKGAVCVAIGFGAGVAVANLPGVHATGVAASGTDLAHKRFIVSMDEIRKNFVFADQFEGSYSKTVTLSDGTTRTIQLTPMIHAGMRVIELKDTGASRSWG